MKNDNIEAIPIHGLLGQSVSKQIYKYKQSNYKYMQGEIDDYVVSELFADDFAFNLYQ